MKRLSVLVTAAALIALFAVALPAQAQATNTATWSAEYYNNIYLSGAPVYTTQVNNGLGLDWGTGSPHASVNADNFSARFRTDAFFNAGTYRFSIRADDEFSFRINDEVVLSTLGSGQPASILTVERTLSGVAKLQLDYREYTGNAVIQLTWQDVNAATAPVPTGTWLAEYYPNTTLTAPALAVFNESSPSHNWGFNAPLSGMPSDYWSARWRMSQYFGGGTYRFTVRADDGVRVYVNNTVVIDRFTESPGSEHIVDQNLPTGNHIITVEYLELYNNAFIDFKIEQVGSNPSTPAPQGTTATVTASVLNVRNAPSAVGSLVVTKIRRNETFAITGRNDNGSWYKLNVNGVEGWVSSAYVRINNTAGGVPVVPGEPQNVNPGDTIVSTSGVRLNLRQAPTTASASLALVPANTSMKVVGRNASSTWFQVEYTGQTGWVSASFVRSASAINYNSIPITG